MIELLRQLTNFMLDLQKTLFVQDLRRSDDITISADSCTARLAYHCAAALYHFCVCVLLVYFGTVHASHCTFINILHTYYNFIIIIRPHCMLSTHAAWHGLCSVLVLVTTVSPAKMAEPIETTYGPKWPWFDYLTPRQIQWIDLCCNVDAAFSCHYCGNLLLIGSVACIS